MAKKTKKHPGGRPRLGDRKLVRLVCYVVPEVAAAYRRVVALGEERTVSELVARVVTKHAPVVNVSTAAVPEPRAPMMGAPNGLPSGSPGPARTLRDLEF